MKICHDRKRIFLLLVFHGTQTTVHVDFQNVQEEKKSSENEVMEGTLVG